MVFLMLMAIVIVAALAIYALHLHRKLQGVDAERERARLELEQQLQDKAKETSKSITILARALIAEELSVTEACLRISWLLTQLDPEARESESYSVFFQVADATAHIPILEAWKALSREQRRAFDLERLKTETTFQDFVLVAAKNLLDEGIPELVVESSNLYYSA